MPRPKRLDFEVFWKAYPLHRDRYAAELAWQRMPDRDRRAACAGIPSYEEECRRSGVAVMYGSNYLTHRRWEDERDSPPSGPPVAVPDDECQMESW